MFFSLSGLVGRRTCTLHAKGAGPVKPLRPGARSATRHAALYSVAVVSGEEAQSAKGPSPRRELASWLGLVVLFVGLRVWTVLANPSRFWAPEEAYQSDLAQALALGGFVEPLPSYLYPSFAGGTIVDSVLVAACAALVGVSWWVLKSVALGWALAAAAAWVLVVRLAVGAREALLLGLMFALAPPSLLALQMFLFGNHAEAALPLALCAAGLWRFLEKSGPGGGSRRFAFGLGVLNGFSAFIVYSHLVVVALQLGLLAWGPRPMGERLRSLGVAAAGFVAGLAPWFAVRLFLQEEFSFVTHVGGGATILARLVDGEGPGKILAAFRFLPWLGRSDGRPWLELLDVSLVPAGWGMLWAVRLVLLAALVGAAVLGARRRLRGEPCWVLPLFVGAHGLCTPLLLAGTALEPRYGQQMVLDAMVALVLVLPELSRRARWGRAAGVAVVGLMVGSAALDSLPGLSAPAPGLSALSEHGLQRFSRGRQDQVLQGFTRQELRGIGLWLEQRSPGDEDIGFAMAFTDASKPLEPRLVASRPWDMGAARTDHRADEETLDRLALLEGFGAGAAVRWDGEIAPALAAFEGVSDAESAAYARGVRWMSPRLQ